MESPLLGMHTGVVHLAWSQSDNEVVLLKGCKYVWTHRDRQPWGQPLPIQCPQCGTVQKWSSIYLNDGSYKFECTYIKCGDRGNKRHGPRHTISVQRPEVGEMLCHDRDNSRLAPSENARKANTGRRERTRASTVPPNRAPASERATRARSLLVLFSLKSTLALYLLYLDSSLSLRLISIHMYPSALRPSRLTFYD